MAISALPLPTYALIIRDGDGLAPRSSYARRPLSSGVTIAQRGRLDNACAVRIDSSKSIPASSLAMLAAATPYCSERSSRLAVFASM